MNRLLLLPLLFATGCSPLKSSPHEARLELMMREMQTNTDDLRHSVSRLQTELQILDGRIKTYEHALAIFKQQDLEKQQEKLDLLVSQVELLEKSCSQLLRVHEGESQESRKLVLHANETTIALSQFKSRLGEIEKELQTQKRGAEELAKMKTRFEALAKHLHIAEDCKMYKVRPGDTLEKIARFHKTSVERIKQINQLDHDLIVVGQEILVPSS